MTIPASQVTRNAYTGNGVTTAFPYTFKVLAATDIRVEVADLVTTGYSVSNVGQEGGGNVLFSAAPASGASVVITLSEDAISQGADMTGVTSFNPQSIEDALDRQANASRYLSERLGRAMVLPGSTPLANVLWPSPVGKALYFVRANAAGTGFELVQFISTAGVITLPLGVSEGGSSATTVDGALAVYGLTLPLVVGDGRVSALTASVLTLGVSGELGSERVLTAGSKITIADAGAGSTLTLTASLPRGYLAGLGLANNGADATNDIDIAVGECRSDDDTENMVLTNGITKRLDAAWAVGGNQGALSTGAIADTSYHVWLIKRTDTGVVDVLFDVSATSPTLPASYSKKRKIGSIVRSAAALLPFIQTGDFYQWLTPALEHDITNPGTAAVLRVLRLPLGIKVMARYNAVIVTSSAQVIAYYSDPATADVVPSLTAAPLAQHGFVNANHLSDAAQVDTMTDTSAQIRTRVTGSDAGTRLRLATLGWFDRRGRDE